MGSHQSHKMMKDEWLTPPDIIESLGKFDLDPCAPIIRPWETATNYYTAKDDGLSKMWFGRVWCNPPYGKATGIWLNKLADHGDGIALTFARTETKMFFDTVWDRAGALLFIKGRLFFYHVNGQRAKHNSGAPSVLIAYGKENKKALENCSIDGQYAELVI